MNDLISTLEANGTRFVRVLWCDNGNVIRGKAVHSKQLAQFEKHGIGISMAQQGLPAIFDVPVPESGLGPVGEVRLVPDWSTLTPLPYAAGHVRVLGDMMHNDEPWSVCPRAFLRQMIAEAEKEGFQVKGAFENEFFLIRRTEKGWAPADTHVFAATQAMDQHRPVIDDIVEALLAQGIPVEQYYPESGPGQQEITVGYTSANIAADRQIAFRETVHAVAAQHDYQASFLPKVYPDQAGCGCHLHLSLWEGDHNLMADETNIWGLSETALGFVAGLLHHLPALMAVTTPSPNSFRRIRPHCWSGAFRCWGIDNREAAVRVPSDPEGPGCRQIEFKTVDAAANPYLALGVIIAAGLDGIRRRLEPGEPAGVDPGLLSAAELQAIGIDPLPTSLGDALTHFLKDGNLQSSMGPALAQAFVAVRQKEWDVLRGKELAEEVELLIGRY